MGSRIRRRIRDYGLTGANSREVEAALGGFAEVVDGSDIVRRQRPGQIPRPSSPISAARASLPTQRARDGRERKARRARQRADGKPASRRCWRAGATCRAGGPLVNSGPRALYGRGVAGPRMLEETDQLMIELGASYCRYNVCIEHTLVPGPARPAPAGAHEVACEAMRQVLDAARPGRELGTLDDIHRKCLDVAVSAWSASRPAASARLHLSPDLDGRAADDLFRNRW